MSDLQHAAVNLQRAGYQKGQDKIKIILEAAENILIEKGYADLSMRKIATKAGISLGNLQYYFPSKEALLCSMLDYAISDYIMMFEDMRGDVPAREHFENIVTYVMQDIKTKRTSVLFPEIWSLSNHENFALEAMDKMYGEYRSILTKSIMEINPELNSSQAEKISLFIASSLEGHTIFTGYKRPWTEQTDAMTSLATQSFLWLIDNGEIPQ